MTCVQQVPEMPANLGQVIEHSNVQIQVDEGRYLLLHHILIQHQVSVDTVHLFLVAIYACMLVDFFEFSQKLPICWCVDLDSGICCYVLPSL